MAFKLAASPNFQRALAQADAALREQARDPMLATEAGAASKPPEERQKRVGAEGEFSRDYQQYGAEIDEKALQAYRFEHEYLTPPPPPEEFA